VDSSNGNRKSLISEVT